jgi:hypothetical protein
MRCDYRIVSCAAAAGATEDAESLARDSGRRARPQQADMGELMDDALGWARWGRNRWIVVIASLVVGLAVGGDAAAQMAVSDKATSPDLLDGTLSAGGDLEEDEAPRTGFFRRPTALDPYFAWKRAIRERYGLAFGGSWGVLWQNYSNSLIGEPNAVGSKFAFNVQYDLWNRNRPDALSVDMAIEDRRELGTELPPQLAGLGAGSGVLTATTWGQLDVGVTQLYLRQNLFDNRFQYAIGKLFAPSYVDPYPFFDGNRQFLSQQFSQSPTIASPLWGFGMVGAFYPAASGLYIKPGIFTPHSSATGSTIGDFFNENQYFYMVEVGVSALARSGVPIQARGAMDTNNSTSRAGTAIHCPMARREPTASRSTRITCTART